MVLCRLLIFSKSTFSKNSFGNTIRVSNSLDPDQAQLLIWDQTDCKGYQQTTQVGKELKLCQNQPSLNQFICRKYFNHILSMLLSWKYCGLIPLYVEQTLNNYCVSRKEDESLCCWIKLTCQDFFWFLTLLIIKFPLLCKKTNHKGLCPCKNASENVVYF